MARKTLRERLSEALLEVGIDVAPDAFQPALGGARTSALEDTYRWEASPRSASGRRLYSYDTMTACVRSGVQVDPDGQVHAGKKRPTCGNVHETGDYVCLLEPGHAGDHESLARTWPSEASWGVRAARKAAEEAAAAEASLPADPVPPAPEPVFLPRPIRSGPPVLVPSATGMYEVLFGFQGGFEQRTGAVVEAQGPHEAVVEAYRRGGWIGSPNNGAGGSPRVRPEYARVRYEAINPNANAPSGFKRCARSTGTLSFALGNVFERIPIFVTAGEDLGLLESWVRW